MEKTTEQEIAFLANYLHDGYADEADAARRQLPPPKELLYRVGPLHSKDGVWWFHIVWDDPTATPRTLVVYRSLDHSNSPTVGLYSRDEFKEKFPNWEQE